MQPRKVQLVHFIGRHYLCFMPRQTIGLILIADKNRIIDRLFTGYTQADTFIDVL